MKEKTLKIAKDLEQGIITETKAKNLLLVLFGVIQRNEQVCPQCNARGNESHEFGCTYKD